MGNFNYYGVIGKNGMAVMNSWDGVERIQTYIRKCTYHGFDTFQEAEDWVFMMMEDRFPRLSGTVLSLYVNQAVFFKKLRVELDF